MFPKMDMASEKAIIENWTPEEVADGNRELGSGPGGVVLSSGDIDVFEEAKNNVEHVGFSPSSVSQETHGHIENNVKESVNSRKEREMVAEEINHVTMPTSKPPLPPGQYHGVAVCTRVCTCTSQVPVRSPVHMYSRDWNRARTMAR